MYDAFGNEVNPDARNTNPFRYAGEYFDFETGNYYLRARFFNPRSGRFTQPDPHWGLHNMQNGCCAIMQSGNLYMYVMHNPVRWVDPSGRAADDPPLVKSPGGGGTRFWPSGQASTINPPKVILRYIIEKNNGTLIWNSSTQTATVYIPGHRAIEIGGTMMNNRLVVYSSILMDSFGLTREQALHMPGDIFSSMDSAALALYLMYNSDDQYEWGAWIYSVTVFDGNMSMPHPNASGHLGYTFGWWFEGSHDTVWPEMFTQGSEPFAINYSGLGTALPNSRVALFHTHPLCRCHNPVGMSVWDKRLSNWTGWVVYAATPESGLLRHNRGGPSFRIV